VNVRSPRALAAVAGLTGTLALATACTGESAAPAAGAAATAQATVTAQAATSSPPAPPVGAGSGSGAPASAGGTTPTPGQEPAGARGAREGDVDGDGKADDVTIQPSGVLLARYSGGGSDTASFSAFGSARVLGAVDADGDGHSEVFVQTDQGAAHSLSTVFRYVDGHLRPVKLDGDQVSLSAGGSTGFIASWTCRPAGVPEAALATASGPSSEPNVYTLAIAYYRFDADRLVQIKASSVGPAALDSLPAERDRITGKPGCGSLNLTE